MRRPLRIFSLPLDSGSSLQSRRGAPVPSFLLGATAQLLLHGSQLWTQLPSSPLECCESVSAPRHSLLAGEGGYAASGGAQARCSRLHHLTPVVLPRNRAYFSVNVNRVSPALEILNKSSKRQDV